MNPTYPVEQFTPEEIKLLEPHFSNLDKPVFVLMNLPETTKAMLFARYSRYQGTLRRLFLDEFADVNIQKGADNSEGEHAAAVAGRVFRDFGDDSVAQLGGVHVACEYSSNLLTKILQRPRIGSYLEQSTRYIAFDKLVEETGRYRYFRHEQLDDEYEKAMDDIFLSYAGLLEDMTQWVRREFPQGDEPEGPWMRATRAKALDSCRGLLPASTLSHMGIYATAQTYELLVMHLLAHPLPEAQECGQMMLEELKKIIPSFMERITILDRGGVWIDYLKNRRELASNTSQSLGLKDDVSYEGGAQVLLTRHHGHEDDLLAALLFEDSDMSEQDIEEAVAGLSAQEKQELLTKLLSGRKDRRHRPGRGMETLSYRFEIVSDYGAFRDMQRHRMLTCKWQDLSVNLGASVPEDIEKAGYAKRYQDALDISAAEYHRLKAGGQDKAASYAVCLSYRLRYVMEFNAREAMQMTELRSGVQGHPSYRAIALAMADHIAQVHPTVAKAFTFLDRTTDPRLERIASEISNERKAAARMKALEE
jgi:thymidylate synthase ThyX